MGGANWSEIFVPSPSLFDRPGRISLAISRSAPATLYASAQSSATFPNGPLLGIWKTTNAGVTWTQQPATGASCSGQCWYDMYLAVHPTDPNIVYFGGLSLYKSIDGGVSFRDKGAGIHVDQHTFAFDPTNPNVIYAGNDGGFFRSTDGGESWRLS